MRILLVLLVMLPSLVSAQKEIELRRKYFGNYEGIVPGYKINSTNDLVDVDESVIQIHLSKDEISLTIGKRELTGTYEVMFQADKYYLLVVKMEGQLVDERILIYKRGKRLSREGLYPQPMSNMKKVKKIKK